MIQLLKLFDKFLRVLNRIALGITCAIISGIVVVIVANVVDRWIYNESIFWADEQCMYMLPWVTFLPSGFVAYKWTHIKLVFLLQSVPIKLRAFLICLSKVICLIFCLILLEYGMQNFYFSFHRMSTSVVYSTKWIVLSIPVGGALMAINIVYLIIADVNRIIKKEYSYFEVVGI